MAQAADKHTPRRRYDEVARTKLKEHIEQVFARRGADCGVDWGCFWGALEEGALEFARDMEQLSTDARSPRDTIDGLIGCIKSIDDLLRKLGNHALFNWNFIADAKDPWCRSHSLKRETLRFGDVTGLLKDFRARSEADIAELQALTARQKIRAYTANDYTGDLKKRLLDIGHGLLGPQVGNNDGPLIVFMHLALKPILGDATPSTDALRIFVRRQTP